MKKRNILVYGSCVIDVDKIISMNIEESGKVYVMFEGSSTNIQFNVEDAQDFVRKVLQKTESWIES